MVTHHAGPGELTDIGPLGITLVDAETGTLPKTDDMEVLSLVLSTGKTIDEHKASGEITGDHSKQQIRLDFEHAFRNLCAVMQSATDVIRLDNGISNDSFEMLAILDRQLIRLAKVAKGFTDKTGDHDTTAAKHSFSHINIEQETRSALDLKD